MAKVSDRNSFRTNQNYSDSFRDLYPSQCESFRTNPKNVLYLVWWKMVKNRSDLIRFNPKQLSEWIRSNYPNESEPIRNQVLNLNQSELGMIQTEFSIKINPNHPDLGFIQIDSIRINPKPIRNQIFNQNQSE